MRLSKTDDLNEESGENYQSNQVLFGFQNYKEMTNDKGIINVGHIGDSGSLQIGIDASNGAMPVNKSSKVTDVTDIVGSFGLWQGLTLATVMYIEVIAAVYNYASPFLAPTIAFNCDANATLIQKYGEDYDVSMYGDIVRSEKCDVVLSGNSTVKCTHFNYSHTLYTRTAVEEWDLVCDRSWLVSFSSTMTLFGDLVASVVLGHLADQIGRRKTLWVALFFTVIAPLVTLFSKSYVQFVIGRFLCGAAGYGFMIVSYVLMMEIVGVKERGYVGIAVKFGYALGGVYVGLISYWLRDWYNIQIACTIPTIILLVLCAFIQESPRWLLSVGRRQEAEDVVKRVARWNKADVANDLKDKMDQLERIIKMEQEKAGKSHFSVWDLVKTPNMRWKTLILIYTWCVTIFIYYGVTLNTGTFGSDMFFSFVIVCAIEIPAQGLALIGVQWFGCKRSLIVLFFTTGVTCFIATCLGVTPPWVATLLLTFVKLFDASCTHLTYNYSAEVFPTTVRSIGMGTSSSFARVAAMVSPFVKEMASSYGIAAPFGLFGGLCIVCSFILGFEPNTFGKKLPETLKEGEVIPLVPMKDWCKSKATKVFHPGHVNQATETSEF